MRKADILTGQAYAYVTGHPSDPKIAQVKLADPQQSTTPSMVTVKLAADALAMGPAYVKGYVIEVPLRFISMQWDAHCARKLKLQEAGALARKDLVDRASAMGVYVTYAGDGLAIATDQLAILLDKADLKAAA